MILFHRIEKIFFTNLTLFLLPNIMKDSIRYLFFLAPAFKSDFKFNSICKRKKWQRTFQFTFKLGKIKSQLSSRFLNTQYIKLGSGT